MVRCALSERRRHPMPGFLPRGKTANRTGTPHDVRRQCGHPGRHTQPIAERINAERRKDGYRPPPNRYADSDRKHRRQRHLRPYRSLHTPTAPQGGISDGRPGGTTKVHGKKSHRFSRTAQACSDIGVLRTIENRTSKYTFASGTSRTAKIPATAKRKNVPRNGSGKKDTA